MSPTRLGFAVLGAVCALGSAVPARAGLDAMTGCWTTPKPVATSLETNASDRASVTVIHERALLFIDRLAGTDELALSRLWEWGPDDGGALGPIWQNGAYDPVTGELHFVFPGGGIDTVHALDANTLLYVHLKAAAGKSATSVRRLKRIGCGAAAALEKKLRAMQRN